MNTIIHRLIYCAMFHLTEKNVSRSVMQYSTCVPWCNEPVDDSYVVQHSCVYFVCVWRIATRPVCVTIYTRAGSQSLAHARGHAHALTCCYSVVVESIATKASMTHVVSLIYCKQQTRDVFLLDHCSHLCCCQSESGSTKKSHSVSMRGLLIDWKEERVLVFHFTYLWFNTNNRWKKDRHPFLSCIRQLNVPCPPSYYRTGKIKRHLVCTKKSALSSHTWMYTYYVHNYIYILL